MALELGSGGRNPIEGFVEQSSFEDLAIERSEWASVFDAYCKDYGIDLDSIAKRDSYARIHFKDNSHDKQLDTPADLKPLVDVMFGDGAFISEVFVGKRDLIMDFNIDGTKFKKAEDIDGHAGILRETSSGIDTILSPKLNFDFPQMKYRYTLTSPITVERGSITSRSATYRPEPMTDEMVRGLKLLLLDIRRRDRTSVSVYRHYRGLARRNTDFS